MFNSITGRISARAPNELFLENSGIEWVFSVSSLSLDSFGLVGETTRVYAWLYHREDQMRLFGFSSERERSLFLDLLKVEGIGPKQAVKILSSIQARDLETALEQADVGKLESAPGIGKKTAQKMILALKGKLTSTESGSSGKQSQSQHPDIVEALCAMGFDKKAAIEAVDRLDAQMADSQLSGAEREKELFRKAIVALSAG